MSYHSFVSKFETLPASLQREVLDFVEKLLKKYSISRKIKSGKKKKLKFDWAGGLSHLKENYTSVELQHEANEYR